jgi:hypothetical protein
LAAEAGHQQPLRLTVLLVVQVVVELTAVEQAARQHLDKETLGVTQILLMLTALVVAVRVQLALRRKVLAPVLAALACQALFLALLFFILAVAVAVHKHLPQAVEMAAAVQVVLVLLAAHLQPILAAVVVVVREIMVAQVVQA